MLRTTMLAAALATAGAAAHAVDRVPVDRVAEVTVTADVAAIANERAAQLWTTLASDLESAIVTRIADRTGGDGARIAVDIRALELADPFVAGFDSADAVLVGRVAVTDPRAGTNLMGYTLSVSLESAAVTAAAADGTPVRFETVDAPGAYARLIDAFAEGVVARLD